MSETKWTQPTEVSDIDVAFPAKVKHLMPSMEEIPEEFKRFSSHHYWQKMASGWFYSRITRDQLPPKDGVDQNKAIRHLKCVLGSFEPKHEHKEAAVAYLMSLWFEKKEVSK